METWCTYNVYYITNNFLEHQLINKMCPFWFGLVPLENYVMFLLSLGGMHITLLFSYFRDICKKPIPILLASLEKLSQLPKIERILKVPLGKCPIREMVRLGMIAFMAIPCQKCIQLHYWHWVVQAAGQYYHLPGKWANKFLLIQIFQVSLVGSQKFFLI